MKLEGSDNGYSLIFRKLWYYRFVDKFNNKKYHNRVIFPVGEQRKFLEEARKIVSVSWSDFSDILNINVRTLRDWHREKYSFQLDAINTIRKLTELELPKNVKIKDPFWYIEKSSKIALDAVIKKYGHVGGNIDYRKKKRQEWWDREGKYKTNIIGILKPIEIPLFSKELAEFTGIVMGDGSLTNYQLQISCNKRDDNEYSFFIKGLIKKLFNVSASICYPKNCLVMKIIVSRKNLVKFCNEKIGLPIGDKLKQGLDIPFWIKKNIDFQKFCIRGLIDTDGCIFSERHKINGKIYSYKRINFTSASPSLINLLTAE